LLYEWVSPAGPDQGPIIRLGLVLRAKSGRSQRRLAEDP
jgi:hypothetical protein